jgi:hypothetical protein
VGSLVRRIWFRADQHDPSIETGVAEPGSDGVPGGAATDDYCGARKRD